MERKSFLCLFFVVLLISPAPILAETLEEVKETRNKSLLPLASYAGLTVPAPLFFALVAAHGIYAVTRYAIRRANSGRQKRTIWDSDPCANIGGTCRPVCFPPEYIDILQSYNCGSYKCCRSGW
mmetsp:Transcript_39675/g.64364  ORF Transcript_39675/g.64364 Transcript_39675/m.64364 type:complete len:124 (-) Transcript_39675:90-461(-)